MPASVDSGRRPIILPSARTSFRYSTASMAPSSVLSEPLSEKAIAEIFVIEEGLIRLQNGALAKQRVVLSEEKSAALSKLALGAKLERALERRMSGQDAVMRKRSSTSAKSMPPASDEKA